MRIDHNNFSLQRMPYNQVDYNFVIKTKKKQNKVDYNFFKRHTTKFKARRKEIHKQQYKN